MTTVTFQNGINLQNLHLIEFISQKNSLTPDYVCIKTFLHFKQAKHLHLFFSQEKSYSF